MQQHQRYNRANFDRRGLLRRGFSLLLQDPEELAERPGPLRRLASLDLAKFVTSGRLADLNDVVVMPVAVGTNVLGTVGEKLQRRASCAFVLVLVLASGLGTDPFSRLDLAQPWPSTHHARLASEASDRLSHT